jgi:zinc protease
MVRKFYALFTLAIITLSLALGPDVYAQSGRGRTANPARDPKPAAAPPVTVPDATSVIKQEQVGLVSRFLLKNGITVIINEQHASPITATVAYFKAGVLDETDALSGAAALLARTLLRGTQLQTAEQIAAKLRAAGAIMEAQAGFDNSSFYLIAPPDKLKEALAIQADVLQHPALSADDVRKEIALNTNSEGRAVNLLLQRNNALSDLFDCSAANREAPENLAMAGLLRVALSANKALRGWQTNPPLTAEQLMSFYKTHYRPDNLIITVTGDVSTFHTLVEIQRLYGTFKAAPQIPDTQNAPQPAGDRKASEASATNSQNKTKPAAAATLKPKAKADGVEKPKAADAGAAKKPDASGVATNAAKPQTPQNTAANAKPTTTEAQPATTDAQATAPPPTPLHYANERGNTGQSIISVGYRFAALDAKERATIDVLCALLGQGRASRLHRSMVEGQGLAQRIDAAYFALADASVLALQMQIAPNLIDRAESAFFREVNTLRRETPSEGEMTRARMLLEKRFFDKNATYMDRAWVLTRAEATQGGVRAFADYRKRLEAVTAADVQRAAAKYLTFANTSVHEYEAQTAAPRTFDAEKFAATVIAWAPTYGEAVEPNQVRATDDRNILSTKAQSLDKSTDELGALESIQPLPVKNFSTLNGPQAFVREDHSQPRVNLTILFQGGRMTEDESNGGITELMLRSMLYGTAKRTQVAQELEQIGADIEIVIEPDFYGLNVSVLSHYAGRALRIARDLIEEPAFREDEVKLARDEQLSLYQRQRYANSARSLELMLRVLYPGHTYSFPAHGREEVVKKLTAEALQTWHAQTVKRQIPLVIVVGDTEGSALISGDVATGFRRNETDTTLKARVTPPLKPGENVEPGQTATTVFSMGFASAKATSEDLTTIELIKALWNGNNGRLMTELRNKQGLVYDVCMDNRAMMMTGALVIQAAVAPEQEQKTRAAVLAEAEKLKAGAGAEELGNAKAIAVTLNLLRLQSQRARSLEYAKAVYYQKQVADVESFAERLSKISAEEIKRIAAAYFKAPAASTGTVRGTQTQAK